MGLSWMRDKTAISHKPQSRLMLRPSCREHQASQPDSNIKKLYQDPDEIHDKESEVCPLYRESDSHVRMARTHVAGPSLTAIARRYMSNLGLREAAREVGLPLG
jgi:hypothetical protein